MAPLLRTVRACLRFQLATGLLVLLLVCGLALVGVAGLATAEHSCAAESEHRVDGESGACHYASVQAAVDAASPGETVVISGEYEENVVVDTPELTITTDNETVLTAAMDHEPVIDVTAPDVEIDGQDRLTVQGGRAGIHLSEVSDTTVRGVTHRSNFYGLRGFKSTGAHIEANRFVGNQMEGVILVKVDDAQVVDNVASGNNGTAFHMRESAEITVIDNVFKQSKNWGLTIGTSHRNTVAGNTIRDNGATGMLIGASSRTEIRDNVITGNDGRGIRLEENDRNLVAENVVTGHPDHGIAVQESTNTTFRANEIRDNRGDGVYLLVTAGTHFQNSTIVDNAQDGLEARGSNVTVADGTIVGNGQDGIEVGTGEHSFETHSSTIGVTRTRLTNGDHGIKMTGQTSGEINHSTITGNTIGVFVETTATAEVIIRRNDILGNEEYGAVVWHERFEIARAQKGIDNLDARRNYWGNESGPTHSAKNPQGTGDRVSSNIDFSPWLDAEGDTVDEGVWKYNAYIFTGLILLTLAILIYREVR